MDTKIDKRQVADLYHSGMNMRQIGEAIGLSNSDICQFMIKHNINARPSGSKAGRKKRVKLEKKKVAALYESGNSSGKISKMFDVTPPTILKFMRKHGIKLKKDRNKGTKNE